MSGPDIPSSPVGARRWLLGRVGTALRLESEDGRDAVETTAADLPRAVSDVQRSAAAPIRWVWSDSAAWYPDLLATGVRVSRAHDLRLAHAILARSALADGDGAAALRRREEWDRPAALPSPPADDEGALFPLATDGGRDAEVPASLADVRDELARQDALIEAEPHGRLRMLVAAESAGALAASEMHREGVPWDVEEHERILVRELGERAGPGAVPARMAEVGAEVREALGDPELALDSPVQVLRALRRAEIDVRSTSKWELAGHDHPAIAPLLRYKQMSRLLTANGWAWLDAWVTDGRYRPIYVPGGVVTGRWAANGGGALQVPRMLRPAVRADPGWVLVAADVSQLEPRVLAAMSGDDAMARAGRGRDLYAGIMESGIVATRQEAKIGVLASLYGSTTGDAARLVPRLREAFPAAMALVDRAAATGERGATVSTWLGRSSPDPAPFRAAQARANSADSSAAEQERGRRAARERGRFTRNFVVQGTAAEWALVWIALIREGLAALGTSDALEASTAWRSDAPHLVYFLHDEVIVHSPEESADAVAGIIRDAATGAGRILFGESGVDFPLDLSIGVRAVTKG